MPNIINAGSGGTTTGTTSDDIIYGTNGDDNIYGRDGDDIIYGFDGSDGTRGEGGNDTLYGGAGNDFVDGGSGADVMYGGADNDTYVVDDAGDMVIELASEGRDTARSLLSSYTLPANVEVLDLSFGTGVTGIGNELDNTIRGNAIGNELFGLDGSDSINGQGGDDLIVGGAGASDVLFGGTGADRFQFSAVDSATANALDNMGDLNFGDGDTIELLGLAAGGGDAILANYQDVYDFVVNTPGVVASTNSTGRLILTIPNGSHTQVINIASTTAWAEFQAANPAPVANDDVASTGENTSVLVDVLANDTDDTGLTLTSASVAPGQGSVAIESGQIRFDPGADFDHLAAGATADVVVSYEVTDTFGKTDTATLTVTVNGVNDAATIGGTDTGATSEDGVLSATGALTVSDVDDGEASFQAGTFGGTLGSLTLAANGAWTYNLNNAAAQALKGGEVRQDTITVHSADGTAHDVTVSVTGANDAAVIGGTNTGSTSEDGVLSTSGTLTVSDADSGEASFQAGTFGGTLGSLTLAANGGWTYNLNNAAAQSLKGGEVRQDTITVHSADGTAKNVVINVTGANDAAVIGGVKTGSVTEDTQPNVSGQLTVSDVDTGQASFQAGSQTGTYGTLSLQANGAWAYALDAVKANPLTTGDVRTENFTVRSADGTASTITVTVKGTNDGAVIGGDDTGCVIEDKDIFALGKLTVTDPDSAAPGFKAGLYGGDYGFVTLLSNGTWVYTLNIFDQKLDTLDTGESVVDHVTVKAADGTTHDIAITVKGTTDLPCLPCENTSEGDANDNDSYNSGSLYSSLSNSQLAQANTIRGTTGSDCIDAKAGNDTVYAKDGNDQVDGGDGNDTIYGGEGCDTLSGGNGDDKLYGGSGRDSLSGGAGNDYLIGGYGADTLTGGAGNDRFVFNSIADTNDTINDFAKGADKIDLSAFKVNNSTFHFNAPTQAYTFSAGHNLIWFQSGGDTYVLGNTDSDLSTAEFMVTLDGTINLASSDFLL